MACAAWASAVVSQSEDLVESGPAPSETGLQLPVSFEEMLVILVPKPKFKTVAQLSQEQVSCEDQG